MTCPRFLQKAYARFILDGIGQVVPWETDKVGILLDSDDSIRRARDHAKLKPGGKRAGKVRGLAPGT